MPGALYDFRVLGAFTVQQIGAGGSAPPPTKVADANPLRRGLYLVSYVADFFIVEDSSPQDASQAFQVPGNVGRIFQVGTPPITDTGQIFLYGNAPNVVVFVAELVEVSGGGQPSQVI